MHKQGTKMTEKTIKPQNYGNKSKENCNLYEIWLNRSFQALTTANDIIKKSNKDENYDGYLWVITTSYYSMFYMTLAILAKKGWAINKQLGDTHKTVQKLFHSVFVVNKIIEEKLYEDYEDTMNISLKLLQYLSKGSTDRNDFQYESSKQAEKRIANKHLNNAKQFHETLSIIIPKIKY